MSNSFDNSRTAQILDTILPTKPGEKMSVEAKAMFLLVTKGNVAQTLPRSIGREAFDSILRAINELAHGLCPEMHEGGENSPYKRMERAFIKDLVDIHEGRL